LDISEKCDVFACESTSDFWNFNYDSLIKHIHGIVGNARNMKVFTYQQIESRFRIHCKIYTLNSMIQPSNVFPKDQKVSSIN
jgi:hypothetical protein